MVASLVSGLQSLSFTQCTLIVPLVLAVLVFILPRVRKAFGIEVSSEMSDSANEGFGAIALFFVFIAASSLSTVQGFHKDGQKVVEAEVAHITNLDRDLVHVGAEKTEGVRAALKAYVASIVDQEWKAMENGKSADATDAALGKLISAVNHLEENKQISEKSIEGIIARLEKLSDSRDERIEVSNFHLSFIYWDIIFCFVAILLIISFFYHQTVPKRIGLAGKMIALAFTLVLLIQTDGVFYGDISIKPTQYSKAIEKMKVRTIDTY